MTIETHAEFYRRKSTENVTEHVDAAVVVFIVCQLCVMLSILRRRPDFSRVRFNTRSHRRQLVGQRLYRLPCFMGRQFSTILLRVIRCMCYMVS